MRNVRKIISGIRLVYDLNKSPPVVNGRDKYDPYELIEKCPWQIDKDEKLFSELKEYVEVYYQLKSTKTTFLPDLMNQKRQLPHNHYKQILEWLASHSVPEHQLSWSSIFEVGVKKWKNTFVESYIYTSQKDKDDPNIMPTKIKVPFYKNGITQWEQLLLSFDTQNTSNNDYSAICGPYVSCLDLTSYFESIFVYHMDCNYARFVHPDQPNLAGNHVNTKSGIPFGYKQRKLRNKFWLWHYINPIWLSMFCDTDSNSGGATNERIHGNIEDKFDWAKKYLTGIERAPSIDQIMTHWVNYCAAKRINNKMIEQMEDGEIYNNYSEREIQEASAIISLYDSSVGLDLLRKHKMHPQSKHGHLKFDVEKNLKTFLKSSVSIKYHRFFINKLLHI